MSVPLFMLFLYAGPASGLVVQYQMDFTAPTSGVVPGGSGLLTVDLPGTPGSDLCVTLGGCDSPPAFSVLVSFVGTVGGVSLDETSLLKVGRNQSIEYTASDLTRLVFNLFDANGDGFRTGVTTLAAGLGSGIWDALDGGFKINGSDSTFTIARIPEPTVVTLLGFSVLLGIRRRTR